MHSYFVRWVGAKGRNPVILMYEVHCHRPNMKYYEVTTRFRGCWSINKVTDTNGTMVNAINANTRKTRNYPQQLQHNEITELELPRSNKAPTGGPLNV